MKNNYRLAITYFTLFSLLLVLSGFWIFILKSGLTFQGIEDYYVPKSYEGILEIAQPHLIAMGVFIMVNSHFFIFSKDKMEAKVLTISLYVSAFILITTPFVINENSHFFIFVKLLTTLIFILLGLHVSQKLFFLTLKR